MNRFLSCIIAIVGGYCGWVGSVGAEEPLSEPGASAVTTDERPAAVSTAPETSVAQAVSTPEQPAADNSASPSAPAAYALPFYLRGVVPGTVARLESTYAMYKLPAPEDESGNTLTSVLTASYKVAPWLAPIARLGLVHNSLDGSSGTAISNLGVGGLLGTPVSTDFKAGFIVLVTLPTGTGAGNDPNAENASAVASASPARYAWDGAIFANNDSVLIGGADLAYVAGGLTVQAEATYLQFIRIRGDNVQKDELRSLLTTGLFAGYFLIPELSVGAELRYGHWLSTPAAVEKNSVARNNLSAGGGVRGYFKLGDSISLRPGLSYHQALDEPLSDAEYKYVQLDLPFVF
ncbi:MAG TPA: hypothetical protein PKK83_12575 [Polyangiaceae bacterium]|nr:hypothetical protein [Polyangiaceae bacterium]HQM11745.1 hypothetical protein [Polyangiaceae bacterium]